jgi:predicted aspartyl protease
MADEGTVTRRTALAMAASASLAGASLAGASLAGVANAQELPESWVPLVPDDDHVVVEARIEGRQVLVMIDNGFSFTGVDKGFVKELGLDRATVATLLNGSEATRMRGVMLELGPLRMSLSPGLVDLSEPARIVEKPVKAILGMEMFNAAIVGIDFSASRLDLKRRQRFIGPPGARRVDLRPATGTKHEALITLNGLKVRAMVDLGYSSILAVSPQIAEKLALPKDRARTTRVAAQFAGDSTVRRTWGLTSIDTVQFAGETMRDVPLDIAPTEGAGPFAEHDAVIGLPLLRRYDLVFDLPGLRLWATPTDRFNVPFHRRYTGLQTEPSARGTVMVIHVAPGSPAEAAGFRQFDILSQIDGAPISSQRLRDIAQGQTARFTYENGETRMLTGARYY